VRDCSSKKTVTLKTFTAIGATLAVGLVLLWALPYMIAVATLGVVCPWTPPGITDPAWKCPESEAEGPVTLGRPNAALRGQGRLAFVGTGSDIFVVNADGTGLRNLTEGANESYWYPAWSPDGSQIALIGDHEYANVRTLEVLDIRTGVVKDMTDGDGLDYDPAWSPDGKWIAFGSSYRGTHLTHAIFLLQRGELLAELTQNGEDSFDPSWSPDGAMIAFTSGSELNREIYAMDADGSAERNLSRSPATDGEPAWSPNGSKIAFVSDRTGTAEVYAMNPDGSAVRRLTHTPGDKSGPVWSPDSRRIAFIDHSDRGIYLIKLDGSRMTRLLTGVDSDRGLSWLKQPHS
jgi:Tol biopolymer transport system component